MILETPDSSIPLESSGAARKARTLRVKHTTDYRYDRPIERSRHRLHLRPIQDARQRVRAYSLNVSTNAVPIEFEDVFGNSTLRFDIREPYSQMTLAAESVVEIVDSDPFAFAKVAIKRSFPLTWLPFEMMMLLPFLTSSELPDAQIEELSDYAMSFVKRNNNDLMETLFAINLTLFREYKYRPGSTCNQTTPYEVFTNRAGVCQDFTQLFICLSRLLGIPARYVCGYLYTGHKKESRAPSDETHAWVELYIPNVGWKGFDPTNGILSNTDHVRLAYGRYYADATPTSGTLFNSARESLHVSVEVTDISAQAK